MLAGAMRQNASRPVVIHNRLTNATLTIETDATVGITDFEEVSNDGVVIQMKSRDYICDTADLMDASGEPVLPARGWIVTEADGSQYEVYAPTGAMPWRWADRSHLRIRIHTRDR